MRILTAGLGCLLVMSGSAGLLVPDIVHSEGPPPTAWRAARDLAYILVGMSLLVPYRLTVGRWQFGVRLGLAAFVAAFLTFLTFEGIAGYLRGDKHWAIIPTAVVVLVAGWSAPGSLLIARATRGVGRGAADAEPSLGEGRSRHV